MVHDKRNQRPGDQDTGSGGYRIADQVPDGIDPLLQSMFDYFRGYFRENGRIIRKTEIDPLAFHKALSRVWIYERTAKDEFICRLAGDEVRSMYDRPIVGCSLMDMIRVQHAPDVMAHHEAIMAMPGVGYMTGRVYLQSLERYGIGERLLLPALDERGAPRFIWGATCYNVPTAEQDTALEAPSRILVPVAVCFAEPS